MNSIYVSIIMPIYNAERFLHQSLGSVVDQTLKNIEIICVNDGSTDSSLSMMKQYAAEDKRIRIIDKANGGYGQSMNCGLRIAKGEYIGILEPDDFMSKDMLETLYNIAKKNNADVVKSNYFEYKTKDNSNNFLEVLEGLPYDEITSAEENIKIIHMRPCIWSAIYRREMLLKNHIVFNETPGASYQDTAFAFKVWVSAQRVMFVKNAYLHYRIDNDGSSVKSSGKVFNICDEFQSMQAFLNEDAVKRERYSKILQVLKLDSYTWNLERISDDYKSIFQDQIALDFIEAQYEGYLDKDYFDKARWSTVQRYIDSYMHSKVSNVNGKRLLKMAAKKAAKKYL